MEGSDATHGRWEYFMDNCINYRV